MTTLFEPKITRFADETRYSEEDLRYCVDDASAWARKRVGEGEPLGALVYTKLCFAAARELERRALMDARVYGRLKAA